MKTVTISETEYQELQFYAGLAKALQRAGVRDWEGYNSALAQASDQVDNKVPWGGA